MMKVGELIEELKKYDREAKVVYDDYGIFREMDAADIKLMSDGSVAL